MADQVGGNSAAVIKGFVERIERLMEEKKQLQGDIRDIFAEAKSNGFDVKALRAVIKLRAQDDAERKEHAAIVDTYSHAVGIEW
jgi:uncharacterized protein (UPF0335 family)